MLNPGVVVSKGLDIDSSGLKNIDRVPQGVKGGLRITVLIVRAVHYVVTLLRS